MALQHKMGDYQSSSGESFPFLELPPELILRVCDYLDSFTVINILSKVCLFLSDLANDELIWKTRIRKRWPRKRYPAVQTNNIDWKDACISRESEYRKWANPAEHMQRKDIHFGICIDVAHITKNDHLIIGLRNHTLYNFKISDIPMACSSDGVAQDGENHSIYVNDISSKTTFQKFAHEGWIWAICSDESKLCSGGWDAKIKLWEYSGEETSSYKCGSAVLCSSMMGNEILAGTFNKTLFKIDSRCKEPIASQKIHARAVLCMQQTKRWIITSSESKIINIIDRNTLKTINTAKIPAGYPGCMSLVGNTMYIGSNLGAIYIYSFDEQLGCLAYIETIENGHEKTVRSVRQTLGCIVTASKDSMCKIWEPSGTPSVIHTLSSTKEKDEICTMDYRNDKLVMGTGEGTLSLFRLKQTNT